MFAGEQHGLLQNGLMRQSIVLAEFLHLEAFCLMRYQCDKCQKVENIYNSRDGVSPFSVDSICCEGSGSKHVKWDRDLRLSPPDVRRFRKSLPSRVFIDFRFSTAFEYVQKLIEEEWDHAEHPISKMYDTKYEALVGFLGDWKDVIGREPETISWEEYLALPPRMIEYKRPQQGEELKT